MIERHTAPPEVMNSPALKRTDEEWNQVITYVIEQEDQVIAANNVNTPEGLQTVHDCFRQILAKAGLLYAE